MNQPQDYRYWATRPLDDRERDWKETGKDWIHDYWISQNHPHRELILSALERLIPFDSLLELGCNAGPNLARIRQRFLGTTLFGIDVCDDAIQGARHFLNDSAISLTQGNFQSLPFPTKSMDVLLSDAALLYIDPPHIEQVVTEIDRVTKKGVVLVERYARSLGGEIVGHVWGRNYKKIFEKLNYKVESFNIRKKDWPHSPNWQRYGKLIIAKK